MADRRTKRDPLVSLEKDFDSIARQLSRALRCRLLPLPQAATTIKKSREWVRSNLPVVVLGPKSHFVKLDDIEALITKRTSNP